MGRQAQPAGQWNLVYPDRDMLKSGFGGQGLYVSPARDIVIAFLGVPDQHGRTNELGRLCREIAWQTAAQSPSAVEGASMSDRDVVLRKGRHIGWWVEGRSAGGRLFMKTWWPTEGLARAVARLVGARTEPGGDAKAANGDAP